MNSNRPGTPPEKLDTQLPDKQSSVEFQLFTSLLRREGGWFVNHVLYLTSAPLGSRTIRIMWQRLLRPLGRFRRRSVASIF